MNALIRSIVSDSRRGIPLLFALTTGLLAQDSVPVSSVPFVCDIPDGHYALTVDLVSSGATAIQVAADNVHIDGNGKTLTYASTDSGSGPSLEPRRMGYHHP